jgi:MerR family transcriptional regulator, light-induced transcriptional regulator
MGGADRTPARAASSAARAARVTPGRLRRSLLAHLVAGDEPKAWTVVEKAMAGGVSPVDVHLELLVPVLRAIGDGWEHGELSVADEHRASAVATRVVGRLGPSFVRPGRGRGTVVLGAPAGEQHAIPGAILADLLRAAGFAAHDLGADTPPSSFVDAARHAPRLVAVLVGATTSWRDPAVRKVVLTLRRDHITVPVLVGGQAITDEGHARRLGADAWSGTSGADAVVALERVMATPAR